MKRLIALIFLIGILFSCSTDKPNMSQDGETKGIDFEEELSLAHTVLDSAVIYDFFSPPVASRVYVYPFIAASECLSYYNDSIVSPFGINYGVIQEKKQIDDRISSLLAFFYVSQELVYSSYFIKNGINEFEEKLKNSSFSTETIAQSKSFAREIANAVLQKASKDGYRETRSEVNYEPLRTLGSWEPTLPDYSDALEPHWSKIKTIFIDSSNSFNCKAPPLYSLEKSSLFYQELIEVKEVVDNLKEDSVNRIDIAKFWDCNPFVPVHKGHVTLAEKKLTPGGHWLNIGKQAMKKSQLGFEESIATYAVLASGIFDGFISCWDAKYQYNYIRPITVIRKEFDENWEIPLYTPNFPEYPSGHSVISGVSSTILTNVFGDHYAYTDSSEVSFGMTVRHFDSFFDACDEAAISRLYGGIHFRSAIVNGVEQGKLIGESILKKAGII